MRHTDGMARRGEFRRASTEEEIRAATLGEPAVLNGPIRLAEYDAQWPQLFAREAERIRRALGGKALRIEHTGSTSIPGLAAKPIIDMVLVVENSSDEDSYALDLVAAGYTLRIREDHWHRHRMFKGPDTDINLHVFSRGCREAERTLLFRDHLRANAEDRELYLRTKRELAAKDWKYVQNYADAKSEIIEEILRRAKLSA